MKLSFRTLLLLSLLSSLLLPTVVFALTTHSETLSRMQWPAHSHGANIQALPQVRRILQLFEEDEQVTLEIHYPANDPTPNQYNDQTDGQADDTTNNQGKSWAESLGRWFVTFGIPLRHILLFADSRADQIVISLVDRR